MSGPDSALIWLMAANAAIWVGIGGYVAFLACRQRALAKRLRQLENWRDDSDS